MEFFEHSYANSSFFLNNSVIPSQELSSDENLLPPLILVFLLCWNLTEAAKLRLQKLAISTWKNRIVVSFLSTTGR